MMIFLYINSVARHKAFQMNTNFGPFCLSKSTCFTLKRGELVKKCRATSLAGCLHKVSLSNGSEFPKFPSPAITQRNGRYGNRSRQWPLLLSSSNSVGNCLLNNKTAAPMIFAHSKFSTNQNRSFCSHWFARADDSVEKRIFLSARQKIS